jgi:GcrA cell cycle regulator
MMEPTSWPAEHSDALRSLLAERLTFAAIADAINLKFSTAYTRNATIGRARRMGLVEPVRPPTSVQAASTQLEKIIKSHPGEREPVALVWPVPPLKTQKMPKLRCAEVEPRHLTLIELERGDCHYPYGGDEEGEAITFCGLPRQPGSSYCAPHFDLSRNPVASPEREAIDNAIWLRIAETA